jgi:hypothetical protein
MIKHIVMWQLEETQDRLKVSQEMKTALEALKDEIPEIIDIHVGINFNTSDRKADVVLISTFESETALAKYQTHAAHARVGTFIKSVTKFGWVVDFQG